LRSTKACTVWVRDGKIARIEQYGARDDALRAAGLS
jgi:ketosteroid isomerase-like protein